MKNQILNVRTLPRAASRKIANTNNRKIETDRLQYLFIVKKIANGGYQTINQRQRIKKYF